MSGSTEPVDPLRTYIFIWAGVAIALGLLLLLVGIDDMRLRIYQKGLVPIASLPPPPPVVYQPAPSMPTTVPTPTAIVETPAPPPLSVPSVAVVPTTVPAALPASVPAGPFAALEAVHAFRIAPPRPGKQLDDQIGLTIKNGADYLVSQFFESHLRNADSFDAETYAGLDALCVYALLHAGQEIDDAQLKPQSVFMKGLIDRVKTFPMNGNRATYSRSLRISALTMFNRPEDRDVIESDYSWLLKNVNGGAYYYDAAPDKQKRSPDIWDNSNSQYGALGMWAASDAGLRPGGTYWEDVTQHWEGCQVHSGGWGYSPGAQTATLAMTAAGVSILFAARDQTAADAGVTDAQPTPLSRAITYGLEWLDEGDHSTAIPGDHPGYSLYGLERAGLASGYKFFGGHDWYSELAQQTITQQQKDGAWTGGDLELAETAFRILFLSRGRAPILLSKLQYEGDWAFRPRDVANLTRFASKELERPLNWQVVGLQRSALEWSDSPVLYISGPKAPTFSDDDVTKLHDFIEAGGLLFTQSERGSAEFDRFAADLAQRLYPSLSLAPLPGDHPLYSSMFPINSPERAQLSAVSNGARLLMVHSSGDLSRQWHPRYEKSDPLPMQMGTNVAVYAAGRSDFLNRTNSIVIPPISSFPLANIPVARVRYSGSGGGDWDPEPGAWKRMSRLIQFDTGVLPSVVQIDMDKLNARVAPVAHLTGTSAYVFNDAEVNAVRQYVNDGGVLFIDSCGGSHAFSDSVNKDLVAKLAGDSQLETIDASHPLLNRTADGMADLTHPKLRLFDQESMEQAPFRCGILHLGKGDLIVCDVDVTSGMLGTNTWGIRGYQTAYAEGLIKNLILWTMRNAGRISAPPSTTSAGGGG